MTCLADAAGKSTRMATATSRITIVFGSKHPKHAKMAQLWLALMATFAVSVVDAKHILYFVIDDLGNLQQQIPR